MNQLISIQNGRKQAPIFSAAEMENRLAKLRTQMAAENIDAVIFTSIHNINYYNHFVTALSDDHTGIGGDTA